MFDKDLIQSTSSWPFVEVRKLLKDRKELIKSWTTSKGNKKKLELRFCGVQLIVFQILYT